MLELQSEILDNWRWLSDDLRGEIREYADETVRDPPCIDQHGNVLGADFYAWKARPVN